jgi:hypothetical protein
VCGGKKRLHIQPTRKRWFCRHCNDGRWHDAIAFQMAVTETNFPQAVEALLGHGVSAAPKRVHKDEPPDDLPPNPLWQQRALAVAAETKEMLWSPKGRSVLRWLYRRGLRADTVLQHGLGFLCIARREPASLWGLEGDPVFLSAGLTIPCLTAGQLWYLKMRRFHNADPKYLLVRGSRPALYLGDNVAHPLTVCFTEGELDALLLAQTLHTDLQLQDRFGIATMGSATMRPLGRWATALSAKRLLAFYDHDEEGTRGADWLRAHFPNVTLPAWNGGKDLTEFFQHGGLLSQLVA